MLSLRLATAAVLVLPLAWAGTASAQTSRTVKLVVPVPPGASTDFAARLLGDQISRMQGVTVVIENRPGASGMIGTEAVSRAAPDGNTLLVTANTYLIDAQVRKANYHPVTSFEPVCYLVDSPALFVVNSASPYRTLADLIKDARAKPGALSMGAVGPGSTFQMGFATFTRTAGVSMTYVPYPGSAPAVNAVLGEHVTAAFSGYAVVSEQIKANKLRALGTATPKRIEPMPELPTFEEQGFKGVEVDNWFGVIAPAKTPADTLRELSAWFKAAMQVPDVTAKFALQGLYPGTLCGAEFGALLRASYDKYGIAIRETGIKTE